MADDVSIVVRVRDATRTGITAVNDNLNRLTRGANQMDKSFGSAMGAAISLAPALIPIAAAAAPIAVGLGAATVAVGAFGAAVVPQAMAMQEAAEAEKKYTDAVEEHGKSSTEAAQAEKAYLAAVQKLPPATRQAAAGLSVLKDEYKEWSNSLADDTMPVLTKGMAVLGGLFPKLTPVVKGASQQLDRFMQIVAGGIQSQSFDRFMQSFADFSTGALAKANDGLIRLTRTMDTGKIGGGLSEFMDYARQNGPLVGETLGNIGEALTKLLVAASDVGVGMLTVINAFAKLVASLPTELVTTLLQVAIAFKAVKMAAAGFALVGVGIQAVTTQIIAMRTAAGASAGGLAALTAAFGALSRGAQLAVAGTAVGLLVLGLMRLSSIGKSAPPDVDRLTTALGNLGRTGKVSGEAAKAFGKDLEGLGEALRVIARPSVTQSIEKAVSSFLGFGKGGPEAKKAAEALDAVDKALAGMVSGGKADLAAAAFDRVKKSLAEQGFTAAEITKEMGDYRAALADAAFEQKLAGDAMGLFGEQALSVQAKLNAQKQSTDGLRQSIHALNNAMLMARGGVIAMEAAIDAASEALKSNGKTLDNNTEKGRANNQALNDLAGATMKAVEAVRESGGSWETASGIYARGRGELIKSATQMGLTKSAAARLADQILKTPNKTAFLKGNMQDLQQKLVHAKNQLARVPDSRKAELRARIAQLEAAIARAWRLLNGLDGTVARTYVVTYHKDVRVGGVSNPGTGGPGGFPKNKATGGIIGAAGGGPRSRMTLVGEQGPELVDLAPGSRVHSNPDTRRMMASSGAGDGGLLHLTIQLGETEFAELLIDPLRRTVARRGGVQATFGKL